MTALSAFFMDAAWPAGARKSVHVCGAPNLSAMVQATAEDFMADHPGIAVVVDASFTYRGFKGVIDGSADMGMTATSLPRELKKLADDRGVALVRTVIAIDGVAVVVHPDNPVRDLSISQLRSIYTGHCGDWRALGGARRAIVPLSQPPYVSSFEGFTTNVMGEAVFTPKATVITSRPIVARVATDPAAIGYVSSNYVTDKVRTLAVNGIAASAENLRSGTYPLRRELAVVMRKDGSELATRLLEYVLRPDKGQRHAARSGAVALHGEAGK
ncbi:MAG: phosphate ABC transporter substrate-binding protein [Bacteroidales bacterium]